MSDQPGESGAQRPVVAVEGREAMREAIIQVIGQARASLQVLSVCLEAGLYKDTAVIEAFKRQLLDERRLQVQLIISDPRLAIEQAEPLVELARRLSSQFEFREPVNAHWQFEKECLVADRKSWFYRDRPDNLIGKYAELDAAGAHTLLQDFDERWLNSQPASEFRRLS